MANINRNLIHNYAVNIKFHSILDKLIHFSKVNEKMFIGKIMLFQQLRVLMASALYNNYTFIEF